MGCFESFLQQLLQDIIQRCFETNIRRIFKNNSHSKDIFTFIRKSGSLFLNSHVFFAIANTFITNASLMKWNWRMVSKNWYTTFLALFKRGHFVKTFFMLFRKKSVFKTKFFKPRLYLTNGWVGLDTFFYFSKVIFMGSPLWGPHIVQ